MQTGSVTVLKGLLALGMVLSLCTTAYAVVNNDGGSAAAEDTRGPSSRRRNFWWWLALGVSVVLIIFLVLLLVLSWCCCARHHQRRRPHKSKRHRTDSDVSTSPDNYTTRQGSHNTNGEAHPHDEAAVTVSNYMNTAQNIQQLGYDDHDAAAAATSSGGHHGRRKIFLAGGGSGSHQRKGNQKVSPSRRHSPQPQSAAAPPPVATWTNVPRNTTAIAAAGRTTVVEHLPPVEKGMSDDFISPNPFSPASVQHTAETEGELRVPVMTPAAATMTTTPPASPVAAFAPSPSPPPSGASPDRVAADVPFSTVAHLGPLNTTPPPLQKQQQRQLAKSPMRSTVKPRNIITADAAPTTAAITRGSSKQYFFGYQRRSPPNRTASSVRAPAMTAAAADQRLSPSPQRSEERQSSLVSTTSSPRPPPQQTSPQRGVRDSVRDSVGHGDVSTVRELHTPPLLPNDEGKTSANGRPSSATPYNSHIFSPLRMTGVETEVPPLSKEGASEHHSSNMRNDSGEREKAAVTSTAAAPSALSARPPRHEQPPLQTLSASSDAAAAAAAATTATTDAPPRHPQQHHYGSTSSAKRRIELFRKGRPTKTESTPPSGARGRSGSAPAVSHRPPLLTTAAAATPSYTGTHTAKTVTKGVPQLFFGKRDGSPSQQAQSHPASAHHRSPRSASPSAASPAAAAAAATQRPPRPGSGNSSNCAKTNGTGGRRASTLVNLSAVHLTQPSPAVLLPSGNGSATAAAAAALVGGGARTSASSRQNSPSHYGSVSSSMNGGNSPSRTSLGRVRSSSRVKFVDEEGAAHTGNSEHTSSATAAEAPTTTTSPTSKTKLNTAASTVHGPGGGVKGRPLVATAAATAAKEALPELPPVPATAQVVIEQGRRTTVQPSPSQQTTTLPVASLREKAQQRTAAATLLSHSSSVRASRETVTPYYSAKIASPLEAQRMPPLRSVPAVLSPPPPQPSHRSASPLDATHGYPSQPYHDNTTDTTRASHVRPPSVDFDSMSSDASTMPAGMLPARLQGRPGGAGVGAARPQSQSTSQQPLFSTVSPYASTRRITPAAGSPAEATSHPRHPSGIEVLRITQASGDVQLMPPPVSSSAAFNSHGVDDHQVVSSASRFASGLLGGGVRGGEGGYVAGGSSTFAPASTTAPLRASTAQDGGHRSSSRFASTTSSGNRRAR